MAEVSELWNKFDKILGIPIGRQDSLKNTQMVLILHRLVELKDPKAMVRLGVWYQSGCRGLPENKRQAVSLFKQAAILSYAEAMFELSICFMDGHGVNEDEAIARDWYQKTKDAGYPCASSL